MPQLTHRVIMRTIDCARKNRGKYRSPSYGLSVETQRKEENQWVRTPESQSTIMQPSSSSTTGGSTSTYQCTVMTPAGTPGKREHVLSSMRRWMLPDASSRQRSKRN